jgi:hypothetical protein
VLRGKLLCWRPLIDEALGQWQQHYETRQQTLQHELAQCDGELQRLREAGYAVGWREERVRVGTTAAPPARANSCARCSSVLP